MNVDHTLPDNHPQRLADPRFARLAWGLGLLILLLSAMDVWLIVLNLETIPLTSEGGWGFRGFQVVLALPLTVLGSLIAARRPRNPIGWLFLLSSGLGLVSEVAGEYAYYAIFTASDGLPGAEVAAWMTGWVWAPGTVAFLTFSFLYFPDGKLLSSRWVWVKWLGVGSVLLTCVLLAFFPGATTLTGIENPFAIQSIEVDPSLVLTAPFILILVPTILAVLSLFIRFRRTRGIQRLQMRWFFIAAVIAPLAVIVGNFQGIWANLALVAIIVTIPTAMTIAILRYRLYSIDLLINRALVYGALTGILALVYFGSVVLLQALIPTQSQLTTVLSTLFIAGLFTPLRRRLQAIIDRRFYRQRYVAESVLASFSSTLRNEVDLDRLERSIVGVVDRTMQPASVSLWLCDTGSRAIDDGSGEAIRQVFDSPTMPTR